VCADAVAYFDDIERLADELAQLLNDDVRRTQLRTLGPRRSRDFSWDEAARRWLSSIPASGRG
jgi:glycosyltransferase involved in cell wall biosynthesis